MVFFQLKANSSCKSISNVTWSVDNEYWTDWSYTFFVTIIFIFTFLILW